MTTNSQLTDDQPNTLEGSMLTLIPEPLPAAPLKGKLPSLYLYLHLTPLVVQGRTAKSPRKAAAYPGIWVEMHS